MPLSKITINSVNISEGTTHTLNIKLSNSLGVFCDYPLYTVVVTNQAPYFVSSFFTIAAVTTSINMVETRTIPFTEVNDAENDEIFVGVEY